jgi:hypothetical protein
MQSTSTTGEMVVRRKERIDDEAVHFEKIQHASKGRLVRRASLSSTRALLPGGPVRYSSSPHAEKNSPRSRNGKDGAERKTPNEEQG